MGKSLSEEARMATTRDQLNRYFAMINRERVPDKSFAVHPMAA